MPLILEGLLTTTDERGGPHIAPMGPMVDESITRVVLRPFVTSTTYQHLRRSGQCVLHVTDDVELLARAAVGRLDPLPPMIAATAVEGWILQDACRWFALRVREWGEMRARAEAIAEVVDRARVRDFFGFNRAKHAVIEAAILATRMEMLPAEEIAAEFARLAVLVEKTGGPAERRAWQFLNDFVRSAAAVRIG